MADLTTRIRDEIRLAYIEIFRTEPGRLVLADLERKARANRIDADAPDPHACIYRVAKQDFVQFIHHMIKESDASRAVTNTRD